MIKSASIVIPALFLAACAADATPLESADESSGESADESSPPDESVGEAASAFSDDCVLHNNGMCIYCYEGGDDCGGTGINCCLYPGGSYQCCSSNRCSSQCWS
jgi:hypothetical protein